MADLLVYRCVHLGDHGECQCTFVNSNLGPPGSAGDPGDPGMIGEFGQEGDLGDAGPHGEDGLPVRKILIKNIKITLKHQNICVLCPFTLFYIVF